MEISDASNKETGGCGKASGLADVPSDTTGQNILQFISCERPYRLSIPQEESNRGGDDMSNAFLKRTGRNGVGWSLVATNIVCQSVTGYAN